MAVADESDPAEFSRKGFVVTELQAAYDATVHTPQRSRRTVVPTD